MNNKDIVLGFYRDVFSAGNLEKLDTYMHDNYIQHNPGCKTGKEGFIEFFARFSTFKPKFNIIKIGADEDMVYVFFKCTLENGQVNKVCDIYRLENGKLAEHWDVVDHGVEKLVPINDNGLF